MLRPSPNHGTQRLPNGDDKYLCLSSFVSTLLVLFEDSSVGSLQKTCYYKEGNLSQRGPKWQIYILPEKQPTGIQTIVVGLFRLDRFGC